ncbi:HAD family phosphatase [Anaerolentibacter hominis]|uniref:HAD family hydrolase n=1 Tax=Anaerolentibacter hominis TaxID=3079009 RepID=UPI0031B873A2
MMKGAIFDVDGTLLDSMKIWEEAGERYLASRGIAAEPDLGRKLFEMTMKEGAQYLKDHYGITDPADQLIAGINRVVESFYREEAELKEGVREFLHSLRERGIRMTAATSTDRYLIEAAFRRLNITEYFEQIFTCSEVGAGKTEPVIYRMAASAMGTRPEETFVFEDAFYALTTASEAGFRTVGIYDASSASLQDKLKERSDLYLTGYGEFSSFWEKASHLK